MEPQVSSQQGGSPGRRRSRSPYKTYVYVRRSIKAPTELFAYRVVLNGIILARSIREIVFTAYMIYRAFAGRGRHGASAVANRCERQSATGLWRLRHARLMGCRRLSWMMGFLRPGGTRATRRPALIFDGQPAQRAPRSTAPYATLPYYRPPSHRGAIAIHTTYI
jgi:hypothetical protein